MILTWTADRVYIRAVTELRQSTDPPPIPSAPAFAQVEATLPAARGSSWDSMSSRSVSVFPDVTIARFPFTPLGVSLRV
jgi:hypothetical protein